LAVATTRQRTEKMALAARRCDDSSFHPPSRDKLVWRSAPVVAAEERGFHRVLFHPLPKISAIAPLPADDVGAAADVAGVVGARHAARAPASALLRSRAVVLLPLAPTPRSWAGGDRRVLSLWPRRLAHGQSTVAGAAA